MKINVFGKSIEIKKEVITILCTIILIIIGFICRSISLGSSDVIIEKKNNVESVQTINNIEPTKIVSSVKVGEGNKEVDEIKVYMVGSVKNKGVITLKKGQIIEDAINAAGGVTEDADLENINLVYKLNENVMLRIKSKSSEFSSQSNQKGLEIIKDSLGGVVQETDKNSDGKININNATASELNTLPGIGEKSAEDIIAFRNKNGQFKKIEDLMKVSGIKDAKFSSIKDFIRVN